MFFFFFFFDRPCVRRISGGGRIHLEPNVAISVLLSPQIGTTCGPVGVIVSGGIQSSSACGETSIQILGLVVIVQLLWERVNAGTANKGQEKQKKKERKYIQKR